MFGPQDSYYEHDGQVYCHYHYSTRFAVKCAGCQTAILKQFVEINRNSIDEHWHPECYMIHKVCRISIYKLMFVLLPGKFYRGILYIYILTHESKPEFYVRQID